MPHRAAHIRCLAVTAAIALLPVADAHALPTLHHGDRGRSVASSSARCTSATTASSGAARCAPSSAFSAGTG